MIHMTFKTLRKSIPYLPALLLWVFVCVLVLEDSGHTWLLLGLSCGPSLTSFKLCYEKHGTHPFLILSASDTKPGQIFCRGFLRSGHDVTLCCFGLLLTLLFFPTCRPPQTLSRSACLSASVTSPSHRGSSPSMTALLWSSCLAACRELTPMTPYNLKLFSLSDCPTLFILHPSISLPLFCLSSVCLSIFSWVHCCF